MSGTSASVGRHLMWRRDINAIPSGANFRPENIDPTTNKALASRSSADTGYNNLNYREWALVLQLPFPAGIGQPALRARVAVRRRLDVVQGHGLQSSDPTTVSSLVPVRVWNYGLSDFDRTHIVKLNWVWDVPRLAPSKGAGSSAQPLADLRHRQLRQRPPDGRRLRHDHGR